MGFASRGCFHGLLPRTGPLPCLWRNSQFSVRLDNVSSWDLCQMLPTGDTASVILHQNQATLFCKHASSHSLVRNLPFNTKISLNDRKSFSHLFTKIEKEEEQTFRIYKWNPCVLLVVYWGSKHLLISI